MRKYITPLKVGLVTLVAVAGLFYALRSVEKGFFQSGETYQVFAVLDNVLGISPRSRVVMAGIEVGYIDSIELSAKPFKNRTILFSGPPKSLPREAAVRRVERQEGRVVERLTDQVDLVVTGREPGLEVEQARQRGIPVVDEHDFQRMAEARARINIRIREDVPLYRDASIAKISESLLGDKLIDLSPGTDLRHPLGEGDQITNVYEEKDFGEIFRQMDLITRDIRVVTRSLRNTIGEFDRDDSLGGVMRRMTEIADNVARLTERVNQTFQSGSLKVEQILDDVAGVTSGTRDRYQEILDNVQQVTTDMRKLIANVNDIVGRGGEDWDESVGGVKDMLQKVNRSLDNLDSITRKINEGQGTIGRLVNDDKVLTKAEGVLDDASSFTRRLARLQMVIDLRSEYHIMRNSAKNYLTLKLVPKSDKFYMIEVIDDPRGSVEVVENEICDESGENCQTTKETTITDEFKFSLQFAKRFYWFALRFGIIEDTGGVGMDWYFLNDDLQFRFDVFQFGTNEFGEKANPRLKAMMMYRPSWLASHIYLAAGGDDFFNWDFFDYFFGAGIYFTDDDLKAIFTTTGVPNL